MQGLRNNKNYMNMPPVKKTTAKPAVKTTAKPVAKKTIAAKESKAEIIARLKSKYDLV